MSHQLTFLISCEQCGRDINADEFDSKDEMVCRECNEGKYPELPKVKDRVKDQKYLYNGKVLRWDGKCVRDVCKEMSCIKRPSYGHEDNVIAEYCVTHKLDGMVDVVNKTCEHPGCKIHPNYGHESDGIRRFCGTHKLHGMINVTGKTCEHSGCKTRPTYGYESDGNNRFCVIHKLDDMVDVVNKTCEHPGCKIKRNYGYESDGIRRFCVTHKLDGMIRVTGKSCESSGCKICPSYGYENDGIRRFCSTHKLDGMVDVVNKTCEHPGCKVHRNYGYESEGIRRFCVTHKLHGMVNLNKHCEYLGCKVHGSYGYESDGIRRFCIIHKLDGMIILSNKPCEHPGCKIRASYGDKSEGIRRFCVTHKLDGMVDVVNKTCEKCGITSVRSDNNYYPHCFACFRYLFPDKPIVKNHGKKELYFHDNIFNIIVPGIINDKRIPNAQTLFRPDWQEDLETHFRLAECDEDAHRDYGKIAESEREKAIQEQDCKKPAIFVRFNPDEYTENGIKYPPCFTFEGENMIVNEAEFNRRADIIKMEWEKAKQKPEQDLTVVRLFYDD